ncbi:hypothetical protein Glove_365g157 [Diversispora epigaea]|uniref:TLDc domain-containing protein n=1 Tax=Diversispora epigaea TaxID=1348612 RepID=A0A397HAS9_9GLOM|nr:hypothetical protein Glove_365g157 [Diversispora epigaea]
MCTLVTELLSRAEEPKESISSIISEEHATEISTWIDFKKMTNIPYKFELILFKVARTDEIFGGYNPLAWNNNNNDNKWTKQKIMMVVSVNSPIFVPWFSYSIYLLVYIDIIIIRIYNMYMYTKEYFIKKVGLEVGLTGTLKLIKLTKNPRYNRYLMIIFMIVDSEYYTFHLSRLRDNPEYIRVVALKELKDYKYDIFEFLKKIKYDDYYSYCFAKFFGISKNPST